jgi:hypothetical protein
MIWKFLLTVAVILGGATFVLARLRPPEPPGAVAPPRPALLPPGMARGIAAAVVGLMVAGFLWYLYARWEAGHTVMAVQVVNANTGAVTPFLARRRDLAGRGFRTLDGREIRLADVERMIIEPASKPRLPAAGPGAPAR